MNFAVALLPAIAAWSTSAAPKVTLLSLFDRTRTDDVLADPIRKQPLRAEVTVVGGLRRERCVSQDGKRYPVNRLYADLVPTSGRSEESLTIGIDELREELVDAWGSRVQTGLFRSPLTAFLYERGWRQNFKAAGFPGIDVEFKEVQRWFQPAAGGVIVDMSCGSGLMTRRLIKSSVYGRVLALDYSEAVTEADSNPSARTSPACCTRASTPHLESTLCRAASRMLTHQSRDLVSLARVSDATGDRAARARGGRLHEGPDTLPRRRGRTAASAH